jgi:hypothetical protein
MWAEIKLHGGYGKKARQVNALFLMAEIKLHGGYEKKARQVNALFLMASPQIVQFNPPPPIPYLISELK